MSGASGSGDSYNAYGDFDDFNFGDSVSGGPSHQQYQNLMTHGDQGGNFNDSFQPSSYNDSLTASGPGEASGMSHGQVTMNGVLSDKVGGSGGSGGELAGYVIEQTGSTSRPISPFASERVISNPSSRRSSIDSQRNSVSPPPTSTVTQVAPHRGSTSSTNSRHNSSRNSLVGGFGGMQTGGSMPNNAALRAWEIENEKVLEAKRSEEAAMRDRARTLAKTQLDEWYKARDQQIAARKIQNKKDEALTAETSKPKDSSKSTDLSSKDSWARVCSLIEFSAPESSSSVSSEIVSSVSHEHMSKMMGGSSVTAQGGATLASQKKDTSRMKQLLLQLKSDGNMTSVC